MKETISGVFSEFNVIPGSLVRAERFGSGLINDTYLCESREGELVRRYILQRINASVFKEPDRVMKNVETVTAHIVHRLVSEGIEDPSAVTPVLVRTRTGRSYHRDEEGSFWRVFHFIEDGVVFDTVRDAGHAYEVGRGLGRFQVLVSDLQPETLHDTLPGFHHTPVYLSAYEDALRADVRKRADGAADEIEFVARRTNLAPLLTGLLNAGAIPVRVVHNDPKVNNVLVHKDTGAALCMLDLDTVKPGSVLFDFGDCVRSAANPAGEDAENLNSVGMDLNLFESILSGYLREAGSLLTAKEREMLPLSVRVITFELGLRFLADYLGGDTYFRINYPSHNLHRARVQFKLLESIESAQDRMVSLLQRR